MPSLRNGRPPGLCHGRDFVPAAPIPVVTVIDALGADPRTIARSEIFPPTPLTGGLRTLQPHLPAPIREDFQAQPESADR